MNSSFVKKYSQNAHVKAKLWRELDDKHLKLNFKINANGVINIFDSYDLAMNKTLKAKQYIEQNFSFNCRVGEYTAIYNKIIENKQLSIFQNKTITH